MLGRIVTCFKNFVSPGNKAKKRRHEDDGLNTPGLPVYKYKMPRLSNSENISPSTPLSKGWDKHVTKRSKDTAKNAEQDPKRLERKRDNMSDPDVQFLKEQPHVHRSAISSTDHPQTVISYPQLFTPQVSFSKGTTKDIQVIESTSNSSATVCSPRDPALRNKQSSWTKERTMPKQRFVFIDHIAKHSIPMKAKARQIKVQNLKAPISKFSDRSSIVLHQLFNQDSKEKYQQLLLTHLRTTEIFSKKKKLIQEPELTTRHTAKAIELVDLTLTDGDLHGDSPVIYHPPKVHTPLLNVAASPKARKSEGNEIEVVAEIHKNSLKEELNKQHTLSEDWLDNLLQTQKENRAAFDADRKLAQMRLDLVSEKSKTEIDVKYITKIQKQIELFDISKDADEIIIEEEEEEFPALSAEAQSVVDKALIPNPKGEILVASSNLQITRHDISTLAGLNWLNDEVINFYMDMLVERGKLDNYPSVYAFNTFFYPKIMTSGYNMVRRWTKKVDIFSYDILLVPVHLGMHWCMMIVDNSNKSITYYDSLGGSDRGGLKKMLEYLGEESKDKKKQTFDTSGWKLITAKDIPQQMNGSDCGMFSCMFAETVSRRKPIKFTQSHMPYFRERMVYEIISKKLMC